MLAVALSPQRYRACEIACPCPCVLSSDVCFLESVFCAERVLATNVRWCKVKV